MESTNLKTDALKALKASGLEQKQVYATKDGNIFFDKALAKLHASSTKQEVEVFEADVETEASQTVENSTKTVETKATAKGKYADFKKEKLLAECESRQLDTTGITKNADLVALLEKDDAEKELAAKSAENTTSASTVNEQPAGNSNEPGNEPAK